MSDRPELSVFIQTYQHAAYIRDAVDGVLRQQTPFDFEVVIADDGSTDGTREILREYRDRRAALRSQLPMLVLMVGYTVVSLWIIAQPIVESR